MEGMKLRALKLPSVAWDSQTLRDLKAKEVVSLNWGGNDDLIEMVLAYFTVNALVLESSQIHRTMLNPHISNELQQGGRPLLRIRGPMTVTQPTNPFLPWLCSKAFHGSPPDAHRIEPKLLGMTTSS